MIIKINGETTVNKLPNIIKEVAGTIQERMGADHKIKIKNAEIGVVAMVEGEPMYFKVEHDGIEEILTINVQLDKKGNILKTVDNEKESFLDDYSKAVAKGIDCIKNEPIESVYNMEDLQLEHVEDGGDIQGRYYVHKVTNERVIQYYRNGVLVGELGYMA